MPYICEGKKLEESKPAKRGQKSKENFLLQDNPDHKSISSNIKLRVSCPHPLAGLSLPLLSSEANQCLLLFITVNIITDLKENKNFAGLSLIGLEMTLFLTFKHHLRSTVHIHK